MSAAGYAGTGFAALVGAVPEKGCCAGCDDAKYRGLKSPCDEAAERQRALVAGTLQELEMAKWFLDNRWTIIGASFAAGGVFFATVAYFVNRNP
jgi:hypothetical protein